MTGRGWRVFPEQLAEAYTKSIQMQYAELQDIDVIYLDMPGMAMMDRSYQILKVDGLTISIPSQDFSCFFEMLRGTKPQILPGALSCIKLRGWMSGLVMTEDMAREVRDKMSELLPSVKLLEEKEDKEFARRIKEVNKEKTFVVSERAKNIESRDESKLSKPN